MIKIVCVLHQNYSHNYYQFHIDSKDDLELLPKYGVKGKENLNTISSCCPGSRAICTDGSVYALNGDTNKWIKLSAGGVGSGGSSSGGDITELPTDWSFATDEDIDNLFK